MNIKVFANKEAAGRAAADAIIAQINAKPNSVLGLPTGSSPIPVYDALAAACSEKRISFKDIKTFNLDEYVGLNPAHPESYRYFMNKNLFTRVDIDLANTNLPCDGSDITDEEAATYDDRIKAAGGIDLQMLGIGPNGHIGFNEPGTAFDSLTHKQKLTQETLDANARFFDNDPTQVPKYAVTLGIKAIMNAKKIVMIITGANKAQAVKDAVEGPVTVDVPASILQLHPDCTFYLDAEAASMLGK